MFRPDKGHIHHRLVGMGLTTKKAVLAIYSVTLVLCVLAVVVTNIRDEQAGLFLVILGAGAGLLGFLRWSGVRVDGDSGFSGYFLMPKRGF